jgi:hypothetical protein
MSVGVRNRRLVRWLGVEANRRLVVVDIGRAVCVKVRMTIVGWNGKDPWWRLCRRSSQPDSPDFPKLKVALT